MTSYIRSFLCKLGLKFKDLALESSYVSFQDKKIEKLFSISSFIFTGLVFVTALLELNNPNKAHLIPKGTIALVSLFVLLLKKQLRWIYHIYFAIVPLGFLMYYIWFFRVFFEDPSDDGFFLAGELVGIYQVVYLLGFRRMRIKVVIIMIVGGYEFAVIRHEMIPESIVLIIGDCFLLLLFFIIQDIFSRRDYAISYTHLNNLTRLQDYLTKELQLGVLIVSSDLKNSVFLNNCFQQAFGKFDDTKQNSISLFLNVFNIESIETLKTSSSSLAAADPRTLKDFLDCLPEDFVYDASDSQVSIVTTTFLSSENTLLRYEVKVTKILWNDKFCFSLTFEEVTSKFLTKALQLADEQKEKVIATLSHELKTPINGIMGLLEMSINLIKDKIVQGYLNHCKSCAHLLLHLVNSTLDLNDARQGSLQLEKTPFYLNDALSELKNLFAFHSQQKNLKFEVEKGPGVPSKIYTDKKRLLEVLVNLLGNAFKFTFRGSVKLNVSIDGNNNHDMLKFSVIDTGVGIKEEEKSRLFAMFGKITENRNSSGIGLGLGVANALVKALNRSDEEIQIEIQSQYNKGSTFSFSIYYTNPDLSSSIIIDIENNERSKDLVQEEFQEIGLNERNVDQQVKKFSSGAISSPRFLQIYTTSVGDAVLDVAPKTERSKLLDSKMTTNYNKQVLVVDDNPFNLMTASFLLGKLGFIVTSAESGEKCLELLDASVKNNKRYDLVLMDIQMPVMSGVETSQIIKQRILEDKLYEVLIIALTANPRTKKALDEYKESGISDAIEKPLKEDDIHNIMNTYFSL